MGFKWSLVSIPDHLGVENVGGRIGAALGPRAFWEIFQKMGGHRPDERAILGSLTRHHTLDPVKTDISANHDAASELVAEAAREGGRSIVIGGGHDHGYSHLLGIRKWLGPEARIGCVNIDAHLDVRKPSPKISSGCPFYLALENQIIQPKDLIEFGIQTHCNSPELWQYAHERQIQVKLWKDMRNGKATELFRESLEKLERQVDAIVISLDLDSTAESFAPGVSAPQSEGFTSTELVELCEIAGGNEKVFSLGVFELNPLHDVGGRTARLAATAVFHYLESARDIRV
ncbi:MAG: formimidoylglutamase [Cryobacterium sp.]|nr:formimidoylglutamase [Oligoflexia bacterium]